MRYDEMDFWSKVFHKSDQYNFLYEATAHIIQQNKMETLIKLIVKRIIVMEKTITEIMNKIKANSKEIIQGNKVKVPICCWCG